MTQTLESKMRKVALFSIAVMLTGCGSENASQTEVNASVAEAHSAKPNPTPKDDAINPGTVDMLLNGKPLQLHSLVCISMEAFSMFAAQSIDGTHLMNVRLKPHINTQLQESFELSIDGENSRITWQAYDPDVKTIGDKGYDISGTAKILGWHRGSDGNYKVDPAVKPQNDMPFQVSFTCK